MKQFNEATPLLDDPEALREQFDRDGYVFLRGVLDPAPLLELRGQIVDILADCGWLKTGTEPMDAVSWTVPKVEGEEDYFHAYDRIQRLEDFHGLAHHPAVMRLMRGLLGDSAFPHPLSIARLVFPDSRIWSTPPHQDFVNNQGTRNLFACWIPLSDCPQAMGSLAVLEGSHRLGLLPVEYSLGAGHRQASIPADASAMSWASADFSLGDVIAFHSLAVHRALSNETEQMRLSVDFRYQAEGDAATARCFRPHFERLSWDEVYRDWSRDELKYYWRNREVELVPWDPGLGELPDDHMKEAIRLQRQFNRTRDRLKQKYADENGR